MLRGNVHAYECLEIKGTNIKTLLGKGLQRKQFLFAILSENKCQTKKKKKSKERGAIRDGERDWELGKPSLGEMTPFSAAPGCSS